MRTLFVLPLLAAASAAAVEMRTPETSRLFDRHVDAKSGVVSYLLKRDLAGFNQQSIYFTARSMTDDGRFLVFDAAPDEFEVRDGKRVDVGWDDREKVLIDFEKDEIVRMPGVGGQIPYIDLVRDRMVYVNADGIWQRDFRGDPAKAELLCRLPPELKDASGGKNVRYHTHLTLTSDGSKAFFDALINHTNLEGVVDLRTGRFEKWGEVDFCCNHGQLNPVNANEALCAWEFAWEKYRWNRKRTAYAKLPRPSEDVYPRLWILHPDRDYRMIAPLEMKYATHENFDLDGSGIYWCGGGVVHHDLKTGLQERLCTMYAAHCVTSADTKLLTFDSPACPWYRGCPWRVYFFNRATGRSVAIHDYCEPYNEKDGPGSRLHPDPHPQFVCHDRYVVCTRTSKGRMDLSVTPVAQLVGKTSAPADPLPPRKEFDLAWDKAWDTSVPWELAFDRQKLTSRWGVSELRAFGVYAHGADGRRTRLEVDTIKSRLTTDEFILRFRVPKGTVRLTAAADEPEPFRVRDAQLVDNLFGEALGRKELHRWQASNGGSWNWRAGGIVLNGQPAKGRPPRFAVEADIPASAAGKPVKFELDVRNRAKYPWWNAVRLRQFDADGLELPDDVVEKRELSCLRPVDKTTRHRVDGRLDRRAKKVRLEIVLGEPDALTDDFGTALAAPGGDVLEVTRLVLRTAAAIPFPAESRVVIGGRNEKYYPDTVQRFAKSERSHRAVRNVDAKSFATLAETLLSGLPHDDLGQDGRKGDPERADRLFGWLCENRRDVTPESACGYFVRCAGLPAAPRPDLGPRVIQVFYHGENRAFDLASGTYGPSRWRERAATAAELKEKKIDLDPKVVGRRIMSQLLSTEPCDYKPLGYTGGYYGGGDWLPYAAASWWASGLDFAVKTGDTVLKDQLVARFKPYLKGGKYQNAIRRKYHVDDTICGVVPCAIYLATGDERMKALGLDYADTQWTPPCEGTLKERHAMPKEVQERYWKEGYTPQTRLWIDDMYMIIAIQTMAYRVTGDNKYLERTAKEMCLYLDELQLKDGETKGLFYHAPDVPYIWGRGDGWMAAGMPLLLSHLKPSSPHYAKIMRGYRDMMAALLKFQRSDGLWGQLVNEPSSWGETSGTAMFTYAFIVGSSRGWLDRATYLPAAKKAWRALCGKLDKYANIADVCIGTGKKNDHQYYLDRSRINGDPHGEAPMMWCANAWLDADIDPADAPTLFFAGDSTLDDYGRKPHPPYASWGTELERHMTGSCKVENFARSGASTKSFFEDGHWERLICRVKEGDFVAIQFGHNDQKWYTPFYVEKRFCAPKAAFRDNLRRMAEEVRAKGATPIFLTPIVRGNFDADGRKLTDSVDSRGICLGSYAEAARELGRELAVDVVDMNRLTHDLLERRGREESMKYFVISSGLVKGKDGEPAKDVTHPVQAGAEAFAELFLTDVKARKLPVADLFRN